MSFGIRGGRAVLAASALLAGCSDPPPSPASLCPSGSFGVLTTPADVRVALIGGPAVRLELENPCAAPRQDVESVRVEMTDPSGAVTRLEATPLPQGPDPFTGPYAPSHEVSTAPTRPGRHVVRASFEPNLGTVTAYVEAVRRPSLTPLTTLPRICGRVAAIGTGLVACDGRVYAKDGGLRAVLPEPLAVAGETVWAVLAHDDGGVDVQRYVLDGGGLTLTAERGVGSGAFEPLRAAESSLFGAAGSALRRVSITEDGGLVESVVGYGGPLVLHALSTEDGGLLPYRALPKPYVGPRGSPDGELCQLLADGGLGGCAPQHGDWAGESPSALYLFDTSTGRATFAKLEVGSGEPRVSRIDIWAEPLTWAPSTRLELDGRVPVFRLPSDLALFPSRGGGELALEALPLEPSDPLPFASDELLWWPSATVGRTRIERRQ